jgi:hypothetical protein
MKGGTVKKSMLEYSKMVLSKMSFDGELVEKEYSKAIKHLSDEEGKELRAWARSFLTNHSMRLDL